MGAGTREVNHEDVLGAGDDSQLQVDGAQIKLPGSSLDDVLTHHGFDPRERRVVNHDGAEAELARITNPDPRYFAAALLFVPGATSTTLQYSGADSAIVHENPGDLLIFRDPSGEFRLVSVNNGGLSHQVSSHINHAVRIEVWEREILISCTERGRSLLEIHIEREPRGLFAYGHPLSAAH